MPRSETEQRLDRVEAEILLLKEFKERMEKRDWIVITAAITQTLIIAGGVVGALLMRGLGITK